MCLPAYKFGVEGRSCEMDEECRLYLLFGVLVGMRVKELGFFLIPSSQ
jgi:hypothetical protein